MRSNGHADPTQSPRALIFTVFGLYLREVGGWMSVSRLIALMDHVGMDSQSVRSSISRLKKRGVLVADRRDGVAGYSLSEYGASVLAEGDRRIFSREEPQRADWVVAVFSVPESERDQRHALRSRLSWLGFATLSSGTWIAPSHVADDAMLVLERDNLSKYVELFHADHLGFGDMATLVNDWWDLGKIESRYRDFIRTYQPLLARWQGPASPGAAEAFADYVRVLTAWRQLPYLDPGLPPALLPGDWPRAAAMALFAELQTLLQEPAREAVVAQDAQSVGTTTSRS